MNTQHYIDQKWDYGADNPQLTISETPQPDVLLAMYAAKYRREGYDQACKEYEKKINDKDRTIAQLRSQLAILMNSTNNMQSAEQTHNYSFNSALFPKPYGATIIDILIELCDSRRERNKYVIKTKTDWYIVWKVLHYFKVYLGNEFNFIDLVNDCVLPNLTDTDRAEKLSVQASNFTMIKPDLPIKEHSVCEWRRIQNKYRDSDTSKPKWHGDSAIERGIIIMVKLQVLLKNHGIDSINYERI